MAASSTEASATAILHSPRSALSAAPGSSDHIQKANPNPSGNASPKKAWKQRSSSNGAPAPVVSIEAGPVIGGPDSWPALSESASKVVVKPSPKASDASSGSPSPPHMHQSEMVSSPSKSNAGNPNFTPGPNRGTQIRPKPTRRSNPSDPANGSSGPMHAPPPVTASPAGSPHANFVSDASWGGDSSSNISSNYNNSSNNTFDSHNNNNHRRGGYAGNKWRGNGGGVHNNGGRRNQEYFDGHHRGQPRGMRPQFVRGPSPQTSVTPQPPPPPPFLATSPQPRPPFVGPMHFPDMPGPMYYYTVPPSPEAMRGMQVVAHPVASPSPFMLPPLDSQRLMLLMQIDYYFSPENLCKDIFLRKNMDEQGWVPISLIAGFNKVKQITNNLQFIIDTLQLSVVVEVQGDKMRKRNDWMNWLLPPEQRSTLNISSHGPPPQSIADPLIPHFHKLGLEGSNTNSSAPMQGEANLTRSSTSGDLTEHAQLMGLRISTGPGQVMGPVDVGRVLVRSDTF